MIACSRSLGRGTFDQCGMMNSATFPEKVAHARYTRAGQRKCAHHYIGRARAQAADITSSAPNASDQHDEEEVSQQND